MTRPRALSRGERVFLRHPSHRDAGEFLERVEASRSLQHPWSYPPDTPEAFDFFLRRARVPTNETLLVCRNEDAAIAGVFSLSQIVYWSFRNAHLGYYAFVPFAGNGYMREGVRLVMRHAFGTLGLHRLQANIQPENAASIALVRGAGFHKEGFSPRYLKIAGRWRDHESWAALADDRRRTPHDPARPDGRPRP
ncbi:MAG: GNAT family N-acetyltransferase [Actinobacteria bacterium]|nr:GNAT family N-acetyltransferase [Actinomycetota bacterium]